MTGLLLGALLGYALFVLLVGLLAARRSGSSPEEYFLAGRGLGKLVLFMALFGTNCTPFILVGIPAQAYRDGIGIFGLNAPLIALGVPLTFWAIGSPARRMGQRLGALTPAELVRRRFDSPALGMLLFALFVAYTVPYMVAAVKGAATSLAVATDGALSAPLAGALVLAVALVYTAVGGMRATAWTNVLQGTLFLGFMIAAFVSVSHALGGPGAATDAVRALRPELLELGDAARFAPRAWGSYGLVITLTVIAFPHMLVRLMAARDDAAIRTSCRWYPVALVALWLPAVMLGVWAAADMPDLANADQVFGRMTSAHMPALLAAFAPVAVLAAVMSTLDAQILTLGSMLVRDVLDPLRGGDTAKSDVLLGRVFAVLVAALVFVLAQLWDDSVFGIAVTSFSGYTTLVPVLFLTVRWRGFSARGAVWSLLAGTLVFVLGETGVMPTAGFMPALWAFVAACVGAVVGSWTGSEGERSAGLARAAFGG